VENAIRLIALVNKSWLFAGRERASKREAAVQSLFATATLKGIESSAWLKETLEKLPAWIKQVWWQGGCKRTETARRHLKAGEKLSIKVDSQLISEIMRAWYGLSSNIQVSSIFLTYA